MEQKEIASVSDIQLQVQEWVGKLAKFESTLKKAQHHKLHYYT